MGTFNIKDSKIDQLNDSGNNVKVTGNSGNTVVSGGDGAAQAVGDDNKMNVGQKKEEGQLSSLWQKIKDFWKWLFPSAT